MTTQSPIVLSVDPGIRNIAFVFIDSSSDKIVSRSLFGCGELNADNWHCFIRYLQENIGLAFQTLPDNVTVTHVIIEKQKHSPFKEITGSIIAQVLDENYKVFHNYPRIVWVDPRNVSRKMKLNPDKDRNAKKKNTILITSQYFNIIANTLTEHEADCLINYLYFCKQ